MFRYGIYESWFAASLRRLEAWISRLGSVEDDARGLAFTGKLQG